MQRIVEAVQAKQDEMLEFLGRLVRMQSPSHEKGHVDKVVDILEAAYREIGFTTRRLKQKKFGNHRVADFNSEKRPRVLLVGHADTVFALDTLNSMPCKREGDRLLGPGVMDMKGGLTVMLFGIRSLLEVCGALKGSLRLVVNTDPDDPSPDE